MLIRDYSVTLAAKRVSLTARHLRAIVFDIGTYHTFGLGYHTGLIGTGAKPR